MKVLFSGGGTGGHVYPAIAMADEFSSRGYDVHFIGTKGRAEEKIVPAHGYKLSYIWISGFQRTLSISNLLFPLKLIISIIQSFILILREKPDLVVGTGGYFSGPVLFVASLLKRKTMIQEQNSYPGITTRLLSSFVDEVHIAYDDAKKHIPKAKKIINSGNPVRLLQSHKKREEILAEFGFKDQFTLAIIGGSLGAKAINQAIADCLPSLNCNVIWQTGETTFNQFKEYQNTHVCVKPFYKNMADIYSVSNIVVCRAGAMTLAEVARCKIPAIMIPYPYAAGNHQYFNAKSVEAIGGGILVEENEKLKNNLKNVSIELINNTEKYNTFLEKMGQNSQKNATTLLVDSGVKLMSH